MAWQHAVPTRLEVVAERVNFMPQGNRNGDGNGAGAPEAAAA